MKNAFGQIRWADALLLTVAQAPKLAVPLATMWWDIRMMVFLQDADGHGWHFFHIYGSLIQGNQEGSPVFCIVIAAVLHMAVHHTSFARHRGSIRHWLHVDDWIIQVPMYLACVLMDAVLEVTSARNLSLQLPKCAFHVPALAGMASGDWPLAATNLAKRIPFHKGGLELLGTEACGDIAVPLYVQPGEGVIPERTLRRKQKAFKLADAALEMLHLAPPAAAKQAVCAIVRGIIAHSLDYDAGVLPCSNLLSHARALDQRVAHVAAATFDAEHTELTEMNLKQLRLPARLSGLQVDMPSHVLPLARLACLVEAGPSVRSAIVSWSQPSAQSPSIDAKRYDGIDEAVSEGILELLSGSVGSQRLVEMVARLLSRTAVSQTHCALRCLRGICSARTCGILPR